MLLFKCNGIQKKLLTTVYKSTKNLPNYKGFFAVVLAYCDRENQSGLYKEKKLTLLKDDQIGV